MEIEHHLFEFALRHLAVREADARFGHEFTQIERHALDVVDFVVQEINLAAARQFALDGLAQQRAVPLHHEGLHREAMRRRRADDGKLAQPRHRHVERARDRRRGEREQVHFGAHRLQALLLAHAEALLLVDDDEADVLELDVLLQQPVRADDDVDLALGEFLQLGLDFLGALEARQHLDLDRPVGEAVAEVAEVLFGQQRGRHQQCDLLARRGRHEGGAHRDFGLAEADVAADHAVHRLRRRQIGDHGFDAGELVGRFLERELCRELLVHRAVEIHRQPRARAALGLDLQQFGGHVADFLGGLFLGLLPLLAAERMQRREFRRSARVAADQMQLRHRHVELVALGVFDGEELGGVAAHVQRFQAAVAAHAMVLVHDGRAQRDLREILDDGFGIAAGALAAAHLCCAFGIELAFGEHAQRGLG